MGRLSTRIARVKEVGFIEAFRKLFPEIEVPDHLPAHIVCPIHADRSPSCYFQDHRWWCFGCGRGGDVIDFAQEHLGLSLGAAVRHVERGLDLAPPDDQEGLSHSMSLLAARDRKLAESLDPREWDFMLAEIEKGFTDRVLPYLRCRDPIVVGLARRVSDMVFEDLACARRPVPVTERGARETLRREREYAYDHARGVERDVLRVTGKDALDVRSQPDLRYRKS